MKNILAFLSLVAALVFAPSLTTPAAAQPCQWQYDAPGNVATATYCGNVVIKGQFIPPDVLNSTTPEAFGAVGDGTTDDHIAINNALNSGRPVFFNQNKNYYVGTAGIKPTAAIWTIYGNYSTITSAATVASNGTGCAFDMIKNANPIIYGGFQIKTTASGAGTAVAQKVKGFCDRSQGGAFYNMFVQNRGSHSIGYWLPYDTATQTSEYYNTFVNTSYNGGVGIVGIMATDNQPVLFDTQIGGGSTHGPNANSWLGSGNLVAYDVPVQIAGTGNTFQSTFQSWATGSYAIVFDNPNFVALSAGCQSNTLLPSYLEGDNGVQNGVQITSHCIDTTIGAGQFIGSIAGGISIADSGVQTVNLSGVAATVSTATLTGSGGGAGTYSNRAIAYQLNGNIITGETFLAGTASTLAGNLTYCGLPITWPNLGGAFLPGSAYVTNWKGITLDAGFTTITAQANPATSCLALYETGSGKVYSPLTGAMITTPGAYELDIHFSGQRF